MKAEWTRVQAMVLGIVITFWIYFEGRTDYLFADGLDLDVSAKEGKDDYKNFNIKYWMDGIAII